MKTGFKNSTETTISDDIKGIRTTSDSSVASRGNVKETIKAYNEHVEEHFYDKKEIDYFFSKIWHWVKNHVLHVQFYTDILGNIKNSLAGDADYGRLSKKAISIESVQSLGDELTKRIKFLERENEKLKEEVDNLYFQDGNLKNDISQLREEDARLKERILSLESWIAEHSAEFKKHLEGFEGHESEFNEHLKDFENHKDNYGNYGYYGGYNYYNYYDYYTNSTYPVNYPKN